MNNIEIISKEACFSCRSCEQSCPKKCIQMLENEEGFLYPSVTKDICINCGVCLKHCPVKTNHLVEKDFDKEFYALKLSDSDKLQESSSGGVFTGLAEYVLNYGGVVFGAAYDEELQVNHIIVSNYEDLCILKGSKYVSSNTNDTFFQVKKLLCEGKIVLYSGSPCQIAGLYSYLGNKPENLYTVDIICHGVPSQKLFNKYIQWLEKKFGEKIIYYGFRDKDVGGWTCGGKTKTKTKIKTINGAIDPYYSSFMRGETYKLSCYSCSFASVENRPADISIGDFWGVELLYPQFESKNGVSCCIINSEKGKKLFDLTKNNFDFITVTKEAVCKYNGQLKSPMVKPQKRDNIYVGIDTLPLNKFINRLNASFFTRTKRFFISMIPSNIKVYIKKLLKK